MSKPWQPYAAHILDAIDRIERIQQRGGDIDAQTVHGVVHQHLPALKHAVAAMLAAAPPQQ